MQQENYTLFRPNFEGVKFKNSYSVGNIIYLEGIREDIREKCCDKIPHIHEYRIVTIKHNPYMGKIVRLKIKKQRYKCSCCKKIKTSKLSDVEIKFSISNSVKKEFEIHISKMRTMKEISKSLGISASSGYNIFTSIEINTNINNDTNIIYMDEFKGNSGGEKYQLALYDEDKNLIDILSVRKTNTIKKWLKDKKINPKIFVTDMFIQFRNLINSTYEHSIIVADKYHLLRQSDWMLRDIRIRLFNSDIKYKNLKKYWKLLSKSPLSKYSEKQKERLRELLNLSDDLKEIYNFRKKFYFLFKANNIDKFNKGLTSLILDLNKSEVVDSSKLSNTLENWKEETINAYKYNINNGFVEGNNNKIKVIKRVSFGVRKYENLRKLIHLRVI